MIINDLSYLETVEEKSVVGASFLFADLFAFSFAEGNGADANADALAFGFDTFTRADTSAFADPFTSASTSNSAAISS